MIGTTADRLAAGSPAFASYAKKRIYLFFETNLADNIAISFFTGIAAGLFAGGTNEVLAYIAAAVMLIVWVQTSVLSGFLRQWLFIAYTAAYFMLPYVFIIRPDTVEAEQADELRYLLSDLAQAVFIRPMTLAAGTENAQTVSTVMFAAFLMMFFIGSRIRAGAKSSDLYCRTRLEQLK